MKLPDWATHIAMNADGSVYAFSASLEYLKLTLALVGMKKFGSP